MLNKFNYVWYGRTMLENVKSFRRCGRKLGERYMIVTLKRGSVYTIKQLDRDYFEVNGVQLHQLRVKGWADGLRLINQI